MVLMAAFTSSCKFCFPAISTAETFVTGILTAFRDFSINLLLRCFSSTIHWCYGIQKKCMFRKPLWQTMSTGSPRRENQSWYLQSFTGPFFNRVKVLSHSWKPLLCDFSLWPAGKSSIAEYFKCFVGMFGAFNFVENFSAYFCVVSSWWHQHCIRP